MSKTGRPTKYKPEYCAAIVKFFSVPKHTQFLKKEITIQSTGKHEREYQLVASDLPTFEGFARSIGVNGDTIVEWTKNHEEFSAAYKVAKDLQKEFLIDNGLKGLYPPASFIFTAKNITDMRDKVETENRTDVTITGLEKLTDEQLDAVIKRFQNPTGKGSVREGAENSEESPQVRTAA